MASPISSRSHENVRLDSWKEIGQYLRRSARTVQRWEKTEGLPVHRVLHNERATVFANSFEVEEWWQRRRAQLEGETEEPEARATHEDGAAQPLPRSRHFAALLAAIVTLAVVLGAAGLILWRRTAGVAAPLADAELRLLARATSERGALATINVGRSPNVVAVTPDGNSIIVGNSLDKTVSVIDAHRRKVIATIPLPAEPMALAMAPDGRTIYAGTPLNTIAVVDLARRSVTQWHTSGPVNDLVITPDGERLYAAMTYDGLSRVDTSNGAETRILTGQCPVSLAISPRAGRLYVSYQCGGPGGSPGRDAIEILDLKTERSLGVINNLVRVGGGLALSADEQQLWASALDACMNPVYHGAGCPETPAGLFHVLRTADRSLLETVVLRKPAGAGAPFLSPGGSRALLVAGDVRVVDTATFKEQETVTVPAGVQAAFAPDGHAAYVPLPRVNALAIFDALPPKCEPSRVGMMSFWPGDGNTTDVRGGTAAVVQGGAGFAPGLIGQAFAFDGKSGFVNFGLRQDNYPPSGESSLSLWLKFFGAGTTMTVVDRMSARGDSGWLLIKDAGGRVHFCLGSPAGRTGCEAGGTQAGTSQMALTAGLWHHVAVTHRGNTLKLYLDGTPQAEWEMPASAEFMNAHLPMRLGADQTSNHFFHGLIDEFAIYHRALGPGEVQTLYRNGAGACTR